MNEIESDPQADAASGLHEIRRRIGNSHALIRSIIRRSVDSATGLDSYAWHLEGRIDAVGRILSAVINQPGIRFDLRQLIADELDDQRVSDGANTWSLDGPRVLVAPPAAEVLALLFYELVINSVEHGAWGLAEGGELRVTWRIEEAEGESLLRLDWVERGAPATLARKGFGTLVLEGMLRYQLDGLATRTLDAQGVRIALTLPMRSLASAEDGISGS